MNNKPASVDRLMQELRDNVELHDDIADRYMDLRIWMIHRLCLLRDRFDYRRDDYHFIVGITPGMKYPYLQIAHIRPDADTGLPGLGKGGKPYISEHATDSEIFQTMLGLAKSYEEHEVREFAYVDGKRIYGPHISHKAMQTVADELDIRE